MRRSDIQPTGHERTFDPAEVIVTKTDLQGKITYANEVFCRVSMFREDEVLGQPHSLIRHPDMPRAVFRLLWQRIQGGDEIFAYVKNLAKNGDHYWVLAHVTPSFGGSGAIVGYHSNRRWPDPSQVKLFDEVYRELRGLEAGDDREAGIARSTKRLGEIAAASAGGYDELIFKGLS